MLRCVGLNTRAHAHAPVCRVIAFQMHTGEHMLRCVGLNTRAHAPVCRAEHQSTRSGVSFQSLTICFKIIKSIKLVDFKPNFLL